MIIPNKNKHNNFYKFSTNNAVFFQKKKKKNEKKIQKSTKFYKKYTKLTMENE